MNKFDSSWRARCSIEACSIKDVMVFCERHYLRKRPAVVLLALQMLLDSRPVGCIVFSAPPREVYKRYGGMTWELARLFIDDEVPCNAETWFISKAIKYIKRRHSDVRYLISYADPSAGHVGTIYKASNWQPDGRTDEGRKTPRFDYVDARTGRKYGRSSHLPTGAVIERLPRVSKFRFKYTL